MTQLPSPDVIEAHARAAAGLAGLTIEDTWWPGILWHLTILAEQALVVERHAGTSQAPPATSFEP